MLGDVRRRHLEPRMVEHVDEGRGEIVVGRIAKLVIDGETATDVDEPAAHLERRAEQLFVVMAGVEIDDGRLRGDAHLLEDRARPSRRVEAVEPHVHVTEMIDLILGDVARVGHPELRGHCWPVWRNRLPTTPVTPRPLV